MKRIDAFAHILPRRYLERLEPHLERTMSRRQLDYYREGVFHYDDSLTDLELRFRKMETMADYSQILVLAVPPIEETGPASIAAEFARLANDSMAELVQAHPDRFAGFVAALPVSDVDSALIEIERAINQLGAAGVQVYTNVLGVPLDDARFEPLFTAVERTGRGVWIHPTRNAAWRDYLTEEQSRYGLWWSLGWPFETSAALSRLVYSGTMERHPDLKVVAHHGAGMVPHFAARLAMGPGFREVKDKLPRPPLDYFRRFYADTALFGASNAVECVLDFFGPDHVLFGTDVPLGPADSIERTIADIEACRLPEPDRSKVYSGNAARLFLQAGV